MDNIKYKLIAFIFFFLLFIPVSNAATTSLSGSKTVGEGGSGSVSFYVNGNGESIGTVGGFFSVSDTSCISITSVTGVTSNKLSENSYKIGYVDFSGVGFTGSKHMATVSYKATGTGCSSTINFKNDGIGNTAGEIVSGNSSSISISVLSNNNNLTSLSTNVGSINFNASTTSYSLSVASNVSSANISASAVSGATVSGVGTKSLSYGSNTFSIVVTAQSGAKKTYSVTINRADDRSSNNNLKELTINSGEISPSFSSGTTNYKIIVPFEVEDMDITAIAEDSKAKVSISGNTGLISEETTDVTVKVTAENGSVKTYTISTTRGKDPNKPLSNISYISELSTSVGTLSPAFNKEVTDYLIWLPYEVSSLDINFILEDSKWAMYEVLKPDTLEVGNNKYTIKVIAEDKTETTYTILVNRGYSAGTKEERNSLLKELKIESGAITTDFNSEIYNYKYKGDFKFIAIANYEDSAVNIYQNEDIYTVLVEDINGGSTVYTFVPNTVNVWLVVIPSIFLFPIVFIGYKLVTRNSVKKKKENKNEKVKK